jgi:hypothetical protein
MLMVVSWLIDGPPIVAVPPRGPFHHHTGYARFPSDDAVHHGCHDIRVTQVYLRVR